MLTEEVGGSHNNFLHILQYGKEMYCKTHRSWEKFWPTTWLSAVKLLEEYGYKDPTDFYVCLNDIHPCSCDVLNSLQSSCRFCGSTASSCIKYSYLPLRNKIKQWCSSPTYCHRMTAHWKEKDHWLHGKGFNIKKELWDGKRFAELSWFWDPTYEWTLPVRCSFCKQIIKATIIEDIAFQHDSNHIQIEYPECYRVFDHTVKKHLEILGI